MKSRIILYVVILMSSVVLHAQTIMNIHQSNGTILQIPLNTIDSITYTLPNPGNLATLSTFPIANVTSTSVNSGGNITNDGGSPVTQRGVVFSTSPNPTTANNSINEGSGTGSYSSTITGLTGNTTYYVRAYATNSAGTAYGNELSFTTTNEIIVSSNITTNTTWETGKVYILTSRIAVVDGVTLTIEPGVIVKGDVGTGANATALIIAQGGKIMAEGTAASPIIFTSTADNIMPGEITSPNLSADLNGLWGGLIVLGKAPISADYALYQIEGIPASDQNGLYGGTDATDNSGIIKYVSIRHGGANIGEGNEINGLTLGGVGSGTTIENVEVVSNQDDGIEFFGGTVNVTNALVYNVGDDAIDTDQAWSGTLDNFIVIGGGDECFELDGPEGTAGGKHTIKNGSVKANGSDGLVDLDPNSHVDMINVYFFNLSTGQDFDQLPVDYTCVFSNLEATLPSGTVLTDFFKDGSDAFVTSVTTNTVGANKSVFTGWTLAEVSGKLADF